MNVEKILRNEWLDMDEMVEADDAMCQTQTRYVWLVLNVSDLTATDVIGAYDSREKAVARVDDIVDVLKSVLYHSNVRDKPCLSDEYVYYVDGRECRLRIVKKQIL